MIIELNSNFALLLVGFSVLVSFILFVPILKLILDLSSSAYSNARLSAVHGKRLKKEDYRTLLETAKLVDMVAMLEGTPYESAFSEVGSALDMDKFDEIMKKEERRQKEFLLATLPRSERHLYIYIRKHEEISVLKEILTSKYAGVDKNILPFGSFDSKIIEHLQEASGIEEILQRLETSEYYEPLKEAFNDFKATNNLFYLTAALDRYIAKQLWKRIALITGKGRHVKQLFGIKFDIINILLLIRSKQDGIRISEDQLLPGYYELDGARRKRALDAENVESLISSLEGTAYHHALSEAISRRADALEEMESALMKFWVNQASRFALSDPLGNGKALAYIINLEKEIRNLRIIAKAKSAGMPTEETEKLIIY